jgi:hypothetical protein
MRKRNLVQVQALCKAANIPLCSYQVDPHSVRSLQAVLRKLRISKSDHVTADISCMTRTHLIAAARHLRQFGLRDFNWTVTYTAPASYGLADNARVSGGWSDTLLLPLGRRPSFRNQGMALGLLLCGHESSRAGIALDALEPAAGIAVIAQRTHRPDVHRTVEDNNEQVLSHLLSLRMPGPRAASLLKSFTSDGWEVMTIDMDRCLHDLSNIVKQLVAGASQLVPPAPIVLYPFGPKFEILIAALLLSISYGEFSWAICPLHKAHTSDYSDGIDRTYRLEGSEVRTVISALPRVSSW